MKQLSIIIPMYNVEPYVERCIRSLQDQDIPENEYELICINDGSPDHSREVVKRLQKEFENIILIDQENQGVSMARNNGMDKASGKYILMVDPDDYLQLDVLNDRLQILNKNDIDIGISGFIIFDEDLQEEYRYDPKFDPDNVLMGVDYYFNWYRNDTSDIRDDHRSWSIFFKRSFLNTNNLRYLSNVPYLEDGEFMARAECLAERMIFLSGPIYMRTTRPGSATHSYLYYSDRARNGFLKAAHNLLNFKANICRNDRQRIYLNHSILHFTILYVISLGVAGYLKEYKEVYKNLKRGPLKKLDVEGCVDWHRKIGVLYNRSIHLFFLYWLVYRFRLSLRIRLKRLFRVKNN